MVMNLRLSQRSMPHLDVRVADDWQIDGQLNVTIALENRSTPPGLAGGSKRQISVSIKPA